MRTVRRSLLETPRNSVTSVLDKSSVAWENRRERGAKLFSMNLLLSSPSFLEKLIELR